MVIQTTMAAPAVTGPTVARPDDVLRSRQAVDKSQAGLIALLRLEADARTIGAINEFRHFVTNETSKIVRARQSFLVERYGDAFRVVCVSSLAAVDQNAPLVRMISQVVRRLHGAGGSSKAFEFRVSAYVDATDEVANTYPFREFVWLPFSDRSGHTFAGLLLARDTAWTESDLVVARRLSDTFAHAWIGLTTTRTRRFHIGKLLPAMVTFGFVTTVLLVALPVPLSALAPAEVVARDPFVISAPLDGVVAEVLVAPNEIVSVGQVLLRFRATELANRVEIAERAMRVAEAQLMRAQQIALTDQDSRRDIAIAEAELQLKLAERNFAVDQFARSELRSDRSGVVLFADRKEIVGKPFATGQQIMEIANPGDVQLRIDMPVSEGLLLATGAEASVYLDSDPLAPSAVRIERADYRAREIEGGRLAIKALGRFEGQLPPTARMGVRGTAKVKGQNVALGLYLFRRPITTVRQWLGL